MAVAATGQTSNGLNYIGNPDYRGYLNYLSQNGDANAKTLLGFVGNDGVFSNGSGVPLSGDVLNANKTFQANFTGAGSGVRSSGAGSTAAPNTDAQDLAYLDSQDGSLRGQLTSTQKALSDGLTQLDDTFNQSTGRTTADRGTAQTGYNDQRTNTTKDKLTAVDSANTNARQLSDSVRRVLGLAGGVNSSAYQFAAPQAIANDTTATRSGINDTFAKNYKTIDDSAAATDLKFQRALQDLADQRKQKTEGLQSGILTQEQGIESQLGQNALTRSQIQGASGSATRAALAPSNDAIASRQAAIDNLFTTYRTPYTVADTAPVVANTDTYQAPATALGGDGTNQTNAAPSSTLSPYLVSLQKKFAADPTAAPVATPTAV